MTEHTIEELPDAWRKIAANFRNLGGEYNIAWGLAIENAALDLEAAIRRARNAPPTAKQVQAHYAELCGEAGRSGDGNESGLKKLSDKATPGPWSVTLSNIRRILAKNGRSILQTHLSGKSPNEGYAEAENNAAFIIALVNGYRSGDMIPRDEVEGLVEALRHYANRQPFGDAFDESDAARAALAKWEGKA